MKKKMMQFDNDSMVSLFENYELNEGNLCWIPNRERPDFAYSDGEEVERRLYDIVHSANDLSSLSLELRRQITDWPSMYHLSPCRSNLLRPFVGLLQGRTLEVGAGCGAITRFIGECGGELLAVEGSATRAAIAADRCRDLENVSVLVDAFHNLKPQPVFDVVTLIGVLEYARIYFPGANCDPVDALLRHARKFLSPHGILIVAIENQLGLKYFAGFGEDHVGVPAHGLEDQYHSGGVVTFGKKVLGDHLRSAGLPSQRWWYPFPDYKLPTTIISEEICSAKKALDLSALIGPALVADPQTPRSPYFFVDRAWVPIYRNEMAPDLANSFLVLASATDHLTKDNREQAFHFAAERRKEYAKQVVFLGDDLGADRVLQQRLLPEAMPEKNVPLKMYLEDAPFLHGEHWLNRLRHCTTTPGWNFEQLVSWAKIWFEAVLELANIDCGNIKVSSSCELPGKLFDAVPRNLIVSSDNTAKFIDLEWDLELPLELGYVLFRGVYLSFLSLGQVAPPALEIELSAVSIFSRIVEALGIVVDERDLPRYCLLENDIQNWVSGTAGLTLENVLSYQLDVRAPLHDCSHGMQIEDLLRKAEAREDRVRELKHELDLRIGQIDNLSKIVEEYKCQIAQLTQSAADRNDKIESLKRELDDKIGHTEHLAKTIEEQARQIKQSSVDQEGKVKTLKQELNSKISQIASLSQQVSERDVQLACLAQVVDERDGKIAFFEQFKIELQKELEENRQQKRFLENKVFNDTKEMMRLSDWAYRMDAHPFRYAVKKNLYQFALKGYHALPVSSRLKLKIKDTVLPLVLSRRANSLRSSPQAVMSQNEIGQHAVQFLPSASRDIFVFAVIDWHFRTQRPQHLARNFAKMGHRVFYFSNHFVDEGEPGYQIEQLVSDKNLFQVKLHVKGAPAIYFAPPTKEQNEMLRRSISKLVMNFGVVSTFSLVQHVYWYPLAKSLPNNYRIYDCMDHHEGFGNVPEGLIEIEKIVLSESDLVVVTSCELEKFAQAYSSNVTLIRNAGEYEHFSTPPVEVFKDRLGRKIVGYYGAIAEWFDLELVRSVAEACPQALFLLIGNDTVKASETLKDLPNVEFVGEVPYSRLPYYLYSFDLCLLPFKVIPLTLATNPVKVYEYLAAGKPVVSVALPEIAQFGELVFSAKSAEEYVQLVRDCLAEPEGSAERELRQQFAKKQTWAHRVKALSRELAFIDFPKISVVVLTYNNIEFSKACLDSLIYWDDYPNLEIVIVDNASADGSQEYLLEFERQHTNVKLILNPENVGFAAGNNIGLEAATGEYLVLLNNDTIVTPGWLLTLLRHLQADKGIGLIGPVTNNIGNEAKIDIAYVNPEEMLRIAKAYTVEHMGQTIPLKTAAFFCAMIPREVYEQVGGLDEAFGRGFFEDDDYCRRIEQLGLRVVCAEDVFVHHHLSASFDKLKQKERQDLFDANKKIYEAKWGKWSPHTYR